MRGEIIMSTNAWLKIIDEEELQRGAFVTPGKSLFSANLRRLSS
jgi:hypothetical protein